MSFFKKKLWMVFLIILALAVILAAISKGGNNPVSNAVNTVITPIQSVCIKITKPVSNFFDYFGNMKQYKNENEELKQKNNQLEAKIKDVSEYIEENERLKKLLDISYTQNEYETVVARVVDFEPDNWFSYLTIDKGSKDGIEVSDTVITASGLVGQVTSVGYNWAKISTIINQESSAGVRIVRNGEIGIAEGDNKLSRTYKCKLGYLVANASVIAGDILETSGLGGIYPPGLMVGKITEVSKDNMGRLDYAVIEPFVNFSDLFEVIIITEVLDNDYEYNEVSGQNQNEQTPQQEETIIDDTLNGVAVG